MDKLNDKKNKRTSESGDIMSAIIESIIQEDNEQYKQFYDYQRKKIAELRKMSAAKASGKKVPQEQVVEKLKNAGILDKKGNLAAPYSDGE